MDETSLGTRRILVVDDDEQFGEVAVRMLREMGNIATFQRGANGSLYKIKEERATHVLLDINMPVLGGSRVIRMIRDTFGVHKVVVLLCSNMEPQSLDAFAMAMRAHGAIPKMYFEQRNRFEIESRLQKSALVSPSSKSIMMPRFR